MTKKKVEVKPVITVDITDCTTIEDLVAAMANAKIEAGVSVSRIEVETLIQAAIDEAVEEVLSDLFDDFECPVIIEEQDIEPEKKPNVFKRFWNWITRK